MKLPYLYLFGLLISSGQAFLQVTISLSKVEISVGQSKYFTCTVMGDPDTIDWYNPQGEKIMSSQRVVVQREGNRSWLTIYNANVDDAGIYRCQASDSVGHLQEATVVLEIYREPSPPYVHGQPGGGKSFKISITKQDDGGAPILNYVIKYRSKDKEDQWMEKKVLGNKDYIILEHLQWNMGYEVQITATNRLGHSEPATYEFTMPPKPNIIADTLFNGLGIGAVIGLAVAALLLILVVTDVSCFFMRQCGLLMCITRRICGKKSGSSGKSKELEEGKAAYLKLLLKEENGKEALSAETIEIKISNDIIQTKESDSKA
ncbi:neural cell adhesion molecule 2 [Pelobates cultripes]|uniref:Neural cell adhesion molecule 2, partial n=1 Tax=Pelobates cultripes TaxID=61616 RepID=A0AAD1QXK1_PELCU|nr:neural cell adhesion molecule 2 [Pelobates cultripes]